LNTTTYPLQINILGPNNQTFRRDVDPITLVSNVTDDCSDVLGRGVRNVTVNFNAYPSQAWTSCQGVDNNNNGTYACILNSASDATFSPTGYNVTSDVYKDYYDSSSKNKTQSFWITTNPEIWSPSSGKDGNIGGWGETWNFGVHVRDLERSGYNFERLNVSLWMNLTGNWQLVNSTICSDAGCAGDTPITFVQKFNCGNIGVHNYKFNVSD
jgi:hypothetical protein